MAAGRDQRAWQAAARLLKQREEELREITVQWGYGLVPFQALICLKDEVFALWQFERELFRKTLEGPPRSDGHS